MRLPNGERREWIKPIMFSGGLGSIEDAHIKKDQAESGNKFTAEFRFGAFLQTDDSPRPPAAVINQEWKW